MAGIKNTWRLFYNIVLRKEMLWKGCNKNNGVISFLRVKALGVTIWQTTLSWVLLRNIVSQTPAESVMLWRRIPQLWIASSELKMLRWMNLPTCGMIRRHWCYWKCQVWGWTSVIIHNAYCTILFIFFSTLLLFLPSIGKHLCRKREKVRQMNADQININQLSTLKWWVAFNTLWTKLRSRGRYRSEIGGDSSWYLTVQYPLQLHLSRILFQVTGDV